MNDIKGQYLEERKRESCLSIPQSTQNVHQVFVGLRSDVKVTLSSSIQREGLVIET